MRASPPEPVAGEPNADVWAIVRCFNEATVVRKVVEELRGYLPNVIGVDDGSSDDSARELAAAGAYVVRHPLNLGAGAALQTGIETALLDPRAQYFVCFDADGQHRPEDAARMVDRLRSEDRDIVIGSRFLGTASNIPQGRRALLRMARVFERFSSGLSLTDAHNGLRAFNRRFAEAVELTMTDMAYASEFIALIARGNFRYAEEPVTIEYTDYSRNKGQRSVNSVNIAMDVWLNQLFRGGRR